MMQIYHVIDVKLDTSIWKVNHLLQFRRGESAKGIAWLVHHIIKGMLIWGINKDQSVLSQSWSQVNSQNHAKNTAEKQSFVEPNLT